MTKANGPPAVGLPPITDARLAKAYAHPTRARILSVLAVMSTTPTGLADELGEPVNNLGYHINVLKKLGCIEVAKTEPAGGGRVVRTYYRATRQPLMHLDAWEQLTPEQKYSWAETAMRMITSDISGSMREGMFLDPDDGHLSRTPMEVDAEGWTETIELLDETCEALFEIQSRASQRLEAGRERPMHQKVAMIQFRSPTSH